MNIVSKLSPYMTDFLGALLMLTLLLSGGWRIPTKRVQSRVMFAMIAASLAGCVLDAALVAMANILMEAVQSAGAVTRFAGDEFVILLEKPGEGALEACRQRIRAGIERWNETSGKPYKLSASIGGSVFDARTDDISDFVSVIDHRMYEEKERYYQTDGERAR